MELTFNGKVLLIGLQILSTFVTSEMLCHKCYQLFTQLVSSTGQEGEWLEGGIH